MAGGRVDYPALVEDALRGVVRDVLARFARGEIGAPHHYYITFLTAYPGVVMPDYLRERYPNEITIVLQYQYWDLVVEEDRFSVTLSFNNVHERLTVPFRAIRIFADPSAEFGLSFDVKLPEAAPTVALPVRTAGEEGVRADAAAPSERAATAPEEEREPEAPGGSQGAEIVTLDRFRRKR